MIEKIQIGFIKNIKDQQIGMIVQAKEITK